MCTCVALAGCSLALSGPKPDRRLSERPDCDTGKGNVVIDGLVGSGLAIGTLVAAANDSSQAGIVLGLLSAVYIGSAVRGNTVVNECRAAFDSFDAEYQAPMREDRVATRPPVETPAAPPKVVLPPVAVAPPSAEDGEAPRATTPVTPEVAPSRPPTPPTPPARKPAIDWQEFWREVP